MNCSVSPDPASATGILMTEGRGSWAGILGCTQWLPLPRLRHNPENAAGRAENKYMELGPRDKVSRSFGNNGAQHHPRRARRWFTRPRPFPARRNCTERLPLI